MSFQLCRCDNLDCHGINADGISLSFKTSAQYLQRPFEDVIHPATPNFQQHVFLKKARSRQLLKRLSTSAGINSDELRELREDLLPSEANGSLLLAIFALKNYGPQEFGNVRIQVTQFKHKFQSVIFTKTTRIHKSSRMI